MGRKVVSASGESQRNIENTFKQAEANGLRLAIKGRIVVIAVMGCWLVLSRPFDRAIDYLIASLILAGLGIAHFVIIGSRLDRSWTKYAFITVDIGLISFFVAVSPLYPSIELPQVMIFRSAIFPYYFLILAVAAFSFSPGLVLYAGIAGSACWIAAYDHSIRDMTLQLDWVDIPANPTDQEVIDVVLNPNFVGGGSRFQEILALLLVALLLAVVMKRARDTVRAHLEADAQNESIADLFGRFVPSSIAKAMIDNEGLLEPIEREATVMFADIENFTALTERLGPSGTTGVLNTYFNEATQIIGEFGGIITQFQGDAILAVFNVPVRQADHASKAVQAAVKLLSSVEHSTFGSERIHIRIGVNTGTVVAGNVGGGGRQSYTVHGDAVNLAARLEVLNKEFNSRLLLSETTAKRLEDVDLEDKGRVAVRGLHDNFPVYTLKSSNPSGD